MILITVGIFLWLTRLPVPYLPTASPLSTRRYGQCASVGNAPGNLPTDFQPFGSKALVQTSHSKVIRTSPYLSTILENNTCIISMVNGWAIHGHSMSNQLVGKNELGASLCSVIFWNGNPGKQSTLQIGKFWGQEVANLISWNDGIYISTDSFDQIWISFTWGALEDHTWLQFLNAPKFVPSKHGSFQPRCSGLHGYTALCRVSWWIFKL